MIRRKIKNVVNNYSEIEILVREATSNESWGPSNSILVKIAVLSSTDANIIQIMPIVWKRLKDTGKKWRHVYKSLILMEFLITRGNPAIADNCRQNIHFLQTLEQFVYEDNNVDVGSRIRKRAETLVRLLKDNDLLRSERNKAAITDLRFSKAIFSQGSNVPIKYGNGVGSLSQGPSTGSFSSKDEINKDYIKADYVVPSNLLEEDMQLQIALAESKEESERQKQLEKIEKLTDQYKISLAVVKNSEDNELAKDFSSAGKLDVWENEIEEKKCENDPWAPVIANESQTDKQQIESPAVNNPWLSIDASNDSLWSNSAKPDGSIDPWSPSQPRKDVLWPTDEESTSGNLWPNISSSSIDYIDPWKDNKITTSISQSAIAAETEYNPWAANAISSNPIPRKFSSNSNKSDSVTNFLASHSYLVDFDNLISVESQKPAHDNNYNPFYEDNKPNCNPFLSLSSKNVTDYKTQIDWNSFEGFQNVPSFVATDSKPNIFATNPANPSSIKPQNNFNPFLT